MIRFNFIFVLVFAFYIPVAWAQKMGCKKPQTTEQQSCNMTVEKQELILKKIAEACKTSIDEGYSDEFIREHKQFIGMSIYLTPDNLKSSIQQKKKQIEIFGIEIAKVTKQIESFDEEENGKKSVLVEEIKAKKKQADADFKVAYMAANLDNAKQIQLYTDYYKLRAEFDKSIKEIGFVDKDLLKSQIESLEKSIKAYQTDLENTEKALAKMEAAAPTSPDAITEAEREQVKKTVQNRVSAIRLKPDYVECGLTDIELYAISVYTGNGYRRLNEALRKEDKKEQSKFQQLTNAINSGLGKLESYTELVRRGTTLDAEAIKPYCEGCVVTMKAFTSTSTANGFSGMQRFIIKGKSGAFIDPISWARGEKEVLFPTNVKFKIIKIEGNQYTMEEVAD